VNVPRSPTTTSRCDPLPSGSTPAVLRVGLAPVEREVDGRVGGVELEVRAVVLDDLVRAAAVGGRLLLRRRR
jgi:hypothetical protein